MNKNKTLGVLSKMAFIISAIYTAKLMLSNTIGIINSLLTIGTVFILEYGKMFFATKSIGEKEDKAIINFMNYTIAIFLFSVSILASQSFLSNQNNIIKNKQLLNSDIYKQQIEYKENLKAIYESKKMSIAELKQRTDEQVESLKSQRDSYPSNYTTKKAEVTNQIKNVQDDAAKQIEKIDQEMKENLILQNQEINTKDVGQLSSTKGYHSLLKTISEKLSNEYSTVTVEQLEMFLFFGISIIFEVVAVMLYYYSRESKENITTTKPSKIVNFEEAKEKVVKSKGLTLGETREKPIGFNTQKTIEPVKEFTSDELNKYVKYMTETQVNGVSKGYQSIGKEIGVSSSVAGGIRSHLIHLGKLEVEGNKTIIKDLNLVKSN